MIYEDKDGNPLGHWEPMSCSERDDLVKEVGGLEILTVFSTITEPEVHIYTEWGDSTAETPFFADDVRPNRHCAHYRFVDATPTRGMTP